MYEGVYVCICMYMYVCTLITYLNGLNRCYWSTKWPFCSNSFSNIMSGRRFEMVTKYLHLNDNTMMPDRSSPEYDRLYKIRPLLESIVPSFKSVYTPSMNISVDESIIGFKGRLSFIQYMPKKPTKWGIKAWVMADSSNGYVSNLNIYTGITSTLLLKK